MSKKKKRDPQQDRIHKLSGEIGRLRRELVEYVELADEQGRRIAVAQEAVAELREALRRVRVWMDDCHDTESMIPVLDAALDKVTGEK